MPSLPLCTWATWTSASSGSLCKDALWDQAVSHRSQAATGSLVLLLRVHATFLLAINYSLHFIPTKFMNTCFRLLGLTHKHHSLGLEKQRPLHGILITEPWANGTAWRCTALNCMALYCLVSRCVTVLYCTALHCYCCFGTRNRTHDLTLAWQALCHCATALLADFSNFVSHIF